jgi:hypothetical protein
MKPLASIPAGGERRFPAAAVASCALVIAGLVLGATVDMAWMILFALGAFGPALLREIGVLGDQDEFQREATRGAGHHAYLAGGLFLTAAILGTSWGRRDLDHDRISASVALAVLVMVYLLGYLTRFWGPRRAAFRILIAFGTFWLAFVVLGHRGVELLAESPVAAPFFLLAFASLRWPRASGALLLATAFAASVFFRLDRALRGDASALVVLLVLVLPLVAAGIALLRAEPADPGREEAGAPASRRSPT